MSHVLPSRIHSSAVIDPGAHLAPDVVIEPFVIIEENVTVGRGTHLLPGTVLARGARVGADCRLGPYATVGGEPMDTRFKGEPSYAVLDDGVVMRDFASVHRATGEGEETHVGEGTLLMSYAHVSHNARVGRGCVLTTHVQLGGHCEVGDYAVLGASALLHQFCRVGAYAMFGAGSASNKDILPFSMARGNPARHYRLNRVGLTRRGVTGERYARLERALRALRYRNAVRLAELALESDDVRLMLEFCATSRRGVARFV